MDYLPELEKLAARINRWLDQLEAKAEPEQTPPRYVSRSEAARTLNCSVRTIDRYIRQGRLTARRLGDSPRILLADLEALLK